MNLTSFVLLVIAIITMFVVVINTSTKNDETQFVLDDNAKIKIKQEMNNYGYITLSDDGSYHINDFGVNIAISMANPNDGKPIEILSSGAILDGQYLYQPSFQGDFENGDKVTWK